MPDKGHKARDLAATRARGVGLLWLAMWLAATACAQEATDPFDPTAGTEPSRAETATFYLRVRMGGDVPRPAVIHLFGRYSRAVNGQHFPPHANITRQGLFKGSNTGIGEDGVLGPGQHSPWIDLGAILNPKGRTHLTLDAIEAYRQYLPSCTFTVDVSRTAGPESLIASFARSGPGAGLTLTLDPGADPPVSCNEEEAPALARLAAALPPATGRRPSAFPILTGLSADADRESTRVTDADLEVLSRLGFSGLGLSGVRASRLRAKGFTCFGVKGYLQSSWCRDRCWLEPDLSQFRSQLEPFASRARELQTSLKPLFWNLGDEYGSRRMERIRDEPLYHPHFRAFLRDQGLAPEDMGATSWESVVPAGRDERDTARSRFYYSCLFRNEVLATHLRNGRQVTRELLPDLPATMNFGEDATYHANLLYRGGDWFRVMEQGDLDLGWTETWVPYQETPQIATYHYAMMRAACRLHGQPFGFYIIVHGRRPWENAAKAASAVAHGASILHFYNYGPRHNGVQDAWSGKPACYGPIRDVAYRVGAVEDDLLRARPVPSPAAIVYSRSSDIRHVHQADNPYGGERISLNLLLQHMGFSPEFVTEDDVLEDRLNGYKLIFLVDSHLLPGVSAKLLAWVERGGVLYGSAGGAMADHLGRPADGLREAGIVREPFQALSGCPGRPMLSYHALRSHGTAHLPTGEALDLSWALQPLTDARDAEIRLRDATGRPLATVRPYGQGRIVYLGFWPGVSYRRAAVIAQREVESAAGQSRGTLPPSTAHPAAYRRLLSDLLAPLPFTPAVTVDDPYVEARLLEHPGGQLLVLVNWSGQERDVTAQVLSARGRPPRVVGEPGAEVAYDGDAWTLRLRLGPFAIAELPR